MDDVLAVAAAKKLEFIAGRTRKGSEIVAGFDELGLRVSSENFQLIRGLKNTLVDMQVAKWIQVVNGCGGCDYTLIKL